MSEGLGAKPAERGADDTLMGVFGVPNEDKDIVQAFTAAAAAVTTLRAQKFYRLIATQDCHVRFSVAGNATTSFMLLKAGVPEVFYTGTFTRLSVIRNSADGNLHLTELQTAERDSA